MAFTLCGPRPLSEPLLLGLEGDTLQLLIQSRYGWGLTLISVTGADGLELDRH